jgi:hypothetical protein
VPVDAGLVSVDAVHSLKSGHSLPDLRVEASVDGTAVRDARHLEQAYLQLVDTMTGVALAQDAGSWNLRKRGVAGSRPVRSTGRRGRDRRGLLRP